MDMATMAPARERPKPFQWLKTGTMWTFSVVFAVLLNLFLFSLMPRLVQTGPAEREKFEKIRNVDFIRLKKEETPPERKQEEKKPPEPKEPERKDIVKRELSRSLPKVDSMRIPYELNPKLPAGQIRLPALDMKTVSLDAPPMKDFYDVGELDDPLTTLVRTPPIYPMMAKRRGIEGWVKVRFLVTESGGVDKIGILEAKPERIFDRAVEQCVKSWRFKPGTVDGQPVKAWAETTVRFELQ
jgi:periplasmic protein TonB